MQCNFSGDNMIEDIIPSKKPKLMTTSRIETLVDGIFAIAMTLLVLTLDVPVLPYPETNAALANYLMSISSKFFVYALSFILLALFWRIHHKQFHNIKRSDGGLLRINVMWMMFVALVPFSTSLIGDYGDLGLAAAFFNFNMLIIGSLLSLNWYYAFKKGLMEKNDLTKEEYNYVLRSNLILPLVSLIAIFLSFKFAAWSELAFALISPFKLINERFL